MKNICQNTTPVCPRNSQKTGSKRGFAQFEQIKQNKNFQVQYHA